MTMKKCRVCGKEYEACRTAKSTVGAFRWRDVACSRECGSIYLDRIIASRSSGTSVTNVVDDMSENKISSKEVETVDAILATDTDGDDNDYCVCGLPVDTADDVIED